MDLLKNNGTFIYIDDKVDEEDIPKKFAQSLQDNHYVKDVFKQLPDIDYLKSNIAIIKMIVMDWTLWEEEIGEGGIVEISELDKRKRQKRIEEYEKKNAAFLKEVLKLYIPIVVFTQLEEDSITRKFQELGIIKSDIEEHPLLLISQKKENVESLIQEWYDTMPSAKIYDKIKTHILTAENEFFKDLIVSKNAWIKSLFELYCKEHEVNLETSLEENESSFFAASNDFMSFMISCIKNRVQANGDFATAEIIKMIKGIKEDKTDVMQVIENTRFLSDDRLLPKKVMPGDVFAEGKTYYLNVRAECDTARYKDKIQLYLLKGDEIKEQDFLNKNICSVCLEEHEKPLAFLGKYNQILYNDTNFTIPYICGGKIVRFRFKDIYIGDYDPTNREVAVNEKIVKVEGGKFEAQVKIYKRKGRVLPPYSLKIQQRFSEYFGRIGLDSIPDIMIDKSEE